MLRNMVTTFLDLEQIETTDAKAKEVRSLAERLITLGKRDSLHARRQALSFLRKKSVVFKLFDSLAPRFADRNGGYTRILRLGPRPGDAAEVAILEFVDAEAIAEEKKAAAEAKGKKKSKAKAKAKEAPEPKEKPKATKAKAKPYNVYKAPVREDFFNDEEYEEAKTSYDGFVTAIKEDVFGTQFDGMQFSIGEAMKKSFVPMRERMDAKVDVAKLDELAGKASSWEEFEALTESEK